MNAYEEKRQARIDRLNAAAAAKSTEAERIVESARRSAAIIPLGQPIMVGHHSESRDRNFRKRIDSKFRRGFQALDESKDLARRAAAAEANTAISSDDPDAIAKLRQKLAAIVEERAFAVMVNARINYAIKLKVDWKGAARAMLGAVGVPAGSMLDGDLLGRHGVPSYRLTNLASEQRRIEGRITVLEREAARPEAPSAELPDGVTMEEAENRIRFFFPTKPDDALRSLLKSHAFLWAPSVGAWQRKVSDNARYAARQVVKALTARSPGEANTPPDPHP